MRLQRLFCLAVLVVAALWLCGVCNAADHYLRAGAEGSNDGSDWTNAYTTAAAAEAGASRGDTIYCAAGEVGAVRCNTPTNGNLVITWKKATVGDHGAAAGWSDDFASGPTIFSSVTLSSSYWAFDGVVGGGYGAWKSGHGFKVGPAQKPFHFSAAISNITLQHIECEGTGRDTADNNADGIYAPNGSTNVTVSECWIHDSCRTLFLTINAADWVVEHCWIGPNGEASDGVHKEAWSAYADDRMTIRWNVFQDISNTAVIGLVNGTGDAEDWKIYGNVFWQSGAVEDVTVSALIRVKHIAPTFVVPKNWSFHNNSVINIQGYNPAMSCDTGEGNSAYNNIWWANEAAPRFAHWVHDYNAGDVALNEDHAQSLSEDPFVDWVNGGFALVVSSPAVDGGVELGVSFAVDGAGVARGQGDAWDIGAYEYSTPVAGPTAPSGATLTAVRQVGWTLAWTDNADNEESYVVEWSTDGGSTWPGSATLPANTESYTIRTLAPGTTYHVRVHATNGAGDSADATPDPASVTTAAASPVRRARGMGGAMLGGL